MNGKTASKFSIKIDTKLNSNTYKYQTQKINFPFNLPCQINNFEMFLNRNGNETGKDAVDQRTQYTGGIIGVFSVPSKKFSQNFSFNIPFSIKYPSGIALSFSTNEFSNEKQSQLNLFVFGDESIRPIVITKEVSFLIASFLLESAKGFEKLKGKWERAKQFIEKNNISVNLLFDHIEQRYQFGFFWEEFRIEGAPEEIQIKDVMFGLSVDLNPAHQSNKFALKMGGKGSFKAEGKSGSINQSNVYIEYSLDSEEQKLEFGGTVSVLTNLLNRMNVTIPSQLEQFAKNTTMSIEWISDPKKKITDEMRSK